MPLTVPDADLKRARAKFRVAFSADAQGALQECTPESVARAIVMSAMSGLYPGGPRPGVWLIPRRNKHKGNALEVQWQISFRGYIQLARRAGWELEPVLVFEGEKFEIHEGDKPGIVHVRNLDLPKTWETLRYGYIRVYPEGKREQARIAYLTKAEIQQRRKKAQDDSIWREWPLEMAYKTLCHYAGNREMFPTDDPTRHALSASEQAEIGSGGTGAETWGSLPAGSKTDSLAARLAAKPTQNVVEVEGRPLDAAEIAPQDAGGETFVPAQAKPGEPLSAAQVKEIRGLVERSKVSLDELESAFGGPLDKIVLPGTTAKELEAEIVSAVKAMKAGKAEPEGQIQLGTEGAS
jgi:phage RecT family recombinase